MPTPYYADDAVTLHLSDCRAVLPTLPESSVDAIVTDPPYEVGIGGQAWDATGVAYDTNMWAHCLRVLKPGGHLLAFGAPRTYHRMACAAEDAGFRVIDQIDWIYTHGKPKGTDLSRAIDRRRDDRSEVLRVTTWLAAARDHAGWSNRRLDALWGYNGMAGLWTTQGRAATVPSPDQWAVLRDALGFDDSDIRPVLNRLHARKGAPGDSWNRREIISSKTEAPRAAGLYGGYSGEHVVSAPHSEEARRWAGWSTSMRPAHDPILVARKSTGYDSLVGGLLRHGVGGLNVAGCPASGGGWPTNILLGHDCEPERCHPGCPVREVGDGAKSFPVFRLESRTPSVERIEVDGVRHETPKPLALMRWLVRLVTPPGGLVLDPFAGSGATLEAAAVEQLRVIGVEQHEPYARLCRARLEAPVAPVLFGGAP